jgi:hypothetical protein
MNDSEKDFRELIDKVDEQERDADRAVREMEEIEHQFRNAISIPRSVGTGRARPAQMPWIGGQP